MLYKSKILKYKTKLVKELKAAFLSLSDSNSIVYKLTEPVSGDKMHAIGEINVHLPQPLGPVSAIFSPDSISIAYRSSLKAEPGYRNFKP